MTYTQQRQVEQDALACNGSQREGYLFNESGRDPLTKHVTEFVDFDSADDRAKLAGAA